MANTEETSICRGMEEVYEEYQGKGDETGSSEHVLLTTSEITED